jgi:hypothetical protein
MGEEDAAAREEDGEWEQYVEPFSIRVCRWSGCGRFAWWGLAIARLQMVEVVVEMVLTCFLTVITNPEDKNFDLEAYLMLKAAEMSK